ncbi:transglutaminase domain-containing protein [Porifericola rhodea]|uniref:transglutaminase domain-containing protein n=1 Tax=Porifericola rhodea TaxID=930972 RepID=UPI00266628FF|nr:DUF3857 domain-containing protein [Porifericola rhodea]WKN30266.1 transglutaminase domain-containing protein [Porifericola rhodea]
MRKIFTLLLIAGIPSFFTNSTLAQSITFGKVTAEELRQTHYDKDSTAAAAVLYENGETSFQYLDNIGFRVVTEHTVRIKIYDKAAYEWGNVKIPLYNDGFNRTEVYRRLDGFVYNLENGMIQRDELEKEAVYEEDINEYWREIKFALPNIKEGCVLEYRYTVESPFLLKLDDWKFQRNIPVKWSEYRLTVPAFYQYMILKQGYFDLEIQEVELDKNEHHLGNYTYQNMKFHWAMKDLPAYEHEEYMTTREDYIAKVMFQLSKVNYPGRRVKDYMTNWPQLIEDLMDITHYGKNFKKDVTEDIVEELTASLTTEQAKAEAIYTYVQQNYAWNDRYAYAPSLTIRQFLKAKEGNSSDINALLLVMLREAGIEAYPALVSTKDHGAITTKFPLLDQFNSALVYAQIDGQGYLLDAIDPDLPFGMISEPCLNGYALVADEDAKEEQWLNVTQQGLDFEDTYIFLQLDEEQQAYTAQVRESFREYSAIKARKVILQNKAQLEQNAEMKDLAFLNLEDKNKPLIITYNTSYEAEALGDLIYINPYERIIQENPFNKPERYYPVNFGLRKVHRYNFTFMLPEGYVVDELPEDVSLSTPQKGITYSSMSKVNGSTVQVSALLQLSKVSYSVEEYQELRSFYAEMIDKQGQNIVLKPDKTE